MRLEDVSTGATLARFATGALAVGVGTLVIGAWLLPNWRDSVLPWAGMTLALVGLLVIARDDRRARRLHDALQRSLMTRGAGVYGLLTLARFLQVELHDLVVGLGEFVIDASLLRNLLRDWLLGFSIQSLTNSIEAVMWPLFLLRAFGWLALAGVFIAFGPLTRLATRMAAATAPRDPARD